MHVGRNLYILALFPLLCSVTCDLNLNEGSPCVTKGLKGICLNIFKCNSAALSYLYTNAGYEIEKHKIPELPEICSYNDNEPVVCCTDCEIGEEKYRNAAVGPHGALLSTEGSLAREKCFEHFNSLPFPCRYVAHFYINKTWIEEKKCHHYSYHNYGLGFAVGGRNAEKWEFPHVALLGYGNDVETAQWLCGGTVISERFILTAAHCSSTRVLGSITFAALGVLKRSDPKETWKIHKIKRIIMHPEYKPPSKYHDIALLETETKIVFARDLLPACLAIDTLLKRSAEASGWGRLGHRQGLADVLQVVNLEEYTAEECSDIYKPHRHLKHGYDHNSQMCYGSHYEVVDTCEGDSGGPLHVRVGLFKCLYTVVGVTSYGKDCGILGSAGMYTKVSYYMPWIEGIVWPEETETRRKKNSQ